MRCDDYCLQRKPLSGSLFVKQMIFAEFVSGHPPPWYLAGFEVTVVLCEDFLVSILSSFDTSASSDSRAIQSSPAVSSSRFRPICFKTLCERKPILGGEVSHRAF